MGDEPQKLDPLPQKTLKQSTPGQAPGPSTTFGGGGSAGFQSAAGNMAMQQLSQKGSTTLASSPRVPSEKDALLSGAAGAFLGLAGMLWLGPEALDELEAARTDIELKGNPKFTPNWLLGRYIEGSGVDGAQLRVHYSTLAKGHIVIRSDDRGYQASICWLPMTHPQLVPRDKTTELGLAVWMEDSVFHGMMGTGEHSASAPAALYVSQENLLPLIFGRSYHGLESVALDHWRDEMEDGQLRLDTSFKLQPPDGPSLLGTFELLDSSTTFNARGQLKVEGAESTEFSVERTPAGILSGHPNLKFAGSWTRHGFSGGIETGFFDGTFETRGKVEIAYPDDKKPFIKGTMNVVATSPERAWAMARVEDPSPHLTGGIQSTNTADTGLALVAWGRLDLILAPGSPEKGPKAKTSPLTARATFLVDPAGDITARGILRLPSPYILVPAYRLDAPALLDKRWHLAGGDVFPGVGGDIWAFARVVPWAGIGPFSLRDLVADGTYSTRPDKGSEIKLAGSFNASAEAGIKAEAGLELDLTIGIHTPWPLPDLTIDAAGVKIGLAGEAVIKGYVDARPEIKVSKRPPGEDRSNGPLKYSIHGELHVAGKIIVKLGASASYKAPGLGSGSTGTGVEYPLANGGIKVTIDHEFGSDKLPEYKFDKIDFDEKKFVREIRAGKWRPPTGGRKPKGGFKEEDEKGRPIGRPVTPVTEEETPPRPPPPDRKFELHVSFNIAKHHHDLYLVVKPDKSVVEMSTGPRKPVSQSIGEAIEMADQRHLTATTEDELKLYEEQAAELHELLADVLELEAEANALAPEAEYLWEADIPGVDDLAERIAEYGVAYGDEDLTGVARLLKGQIQATEVEEVGPQRFSYKGATRIGTSEEFHGDFGDHEWDWRLEPRPERPSSELDFPSQLILRHPVNEWTAGGFTHPDYYVSRPGGHYLYIGGPTKGWDADEWRRHVTDDLLAAKERSGITTIAARRSAVLADFVSQGYSGLTWDDIWLTGPRGRGWQGHHVQEWSWNGDHAVGNIQYLKQPDHHPATTWFNRRRDDIKRQLNIPV